MWERLVSCIKKCLKKSLTTKRTTYIELQTVVAEIELVLNNRPLIDDYDDDQEDLLTPNHLVFGRRLDQNVIANKEQSAKAQHAKVKTMTDHFWNTWRKEYLTTLRESNTKKANKGQTIEKGDIVIVFEENVPRHLWRMGRVEDLLISTSDNRIRGATVRLGKTGTLLNRPVNKLYPLEIRRKVHSEKPPTRIRRDAAVIGELKRKFGH